jgi:hypothetical protein
MRTSALGLTPEIASQRSGLTKAPGSGGWWWDRAIAKINSSLFAR